MNEKKPVKISVSTFFLIIAIIVNIAMGIYIYIISVEKIKAEEKAEALDSEVTELEGKVDNLQGKIDSISNTINSDIINPNTTNTKKLLTKEHICLV